MWTGVTAPSWEGASRCSLHFQQNLTLPRASSSTCLIHWLKQVVVSTKASANPSLWHNILLLQAGKALTHIPQAQGPARTPFTNHGVPNLWRGGQVARHGGHTASAPPRAAEVRDWELALLGRIWANTDRQTFHEKRHAAFNLMAVSTHREYLSDCPFSSTGWHTGVPRGCPAGQDSPGSEREGLQGQGRWQEVRAIRLLLLHAGWLHRKINLHQKKAHEKRRV